MFKQNPVWDVWLRSRNSDNNVRNVNNDGNANNNNDPSKSNGGCVPDLFLILCLNKSSLL